jgi:hypothetical protein
MVLGGAVGVVVVVAWINVASLLIAWLPSRRQEFVTRLALGATTARVLRQLVLETLVWATAGMVAGLAIATSFVHYSVLSVCQPRCPTTLSQREWPRDPSDCGTVADQCVCHGGRSMCARGESIQGPRSSTSVGDGRSWTPNHRRHSGRPLYRAAICRCRDLIGFRHLGTLATPFGSQGATLAMEVSRSEMHEPDDADNRQFFLRILTALESRREIRAVAAPVMCHRRLHWATFGFRARANRRSSPDSIASGGEKRHRK